MEKNNNNSNSNSNGFSNSEMYNMSRNGAIESVGFWTADLDYIKEKTTFAKAPNGTIASLCDWIDNGATYYEKVDGRWYELSKERTEAIQAELREKGRKMVEAAKKEMEINSIEAELEASFGKLDDTEHYDIISDQVFGDFELICMHIPTSDDSYMNVELGLSRQGEEKYVTAANELWSVDFEIRYEDEVAEVATEIARIMGEADKLMFRIFQCYKDETGRIWQLEAVDERCETNDYECTLVSIGEADEEVIYASMDQEANSIRYYSEDIDDYVNIYPDARVDLTHAA